MALKFCRIELDYCKPKLWSIIIKEAFPFRSSGAPAYVCKEMRASDIIALTENKFREKFKFSESDKNI